MEPKFWKKLDFWAIYALVILVPLLCLSPRIIDSFYDEKGKLESDSIDSRTSKIVICQDRYKYLIVSSSFGTGLTQMFENSPNGVRAVECPREMKSSN